MDTKELLKKVRKIEIKTRRLSDHMFGGEYHSAFKGRGMTFSEVRQYQFGDDVRSIDWNVTARYNEPYIKVFEEERELTLMLIVDVSGSEMFGTDGQFKNEIITETATNSSSSEMLSEQRDTNQEVKSIIEDNQSGDYEKSFSEEALSITDEIEESNLTEEDHVSNGLENFGVEGETAPDLFSSDNETTKTEGLLSAETSENISEDDDLEIPAFLRRQKN